MLKTKVRPIATGARWAARPATAVLSTTVTRKKASTASTMKPIAGVIVTGVPAGLGGGDRAGGEPAEVQGRVKMPSGYTAIGADEDHQGEAMGEGNRGDPAAGRPADDRGGAGADEHQREGADELRKELGCN